MIRNTINLCPEGICFGTIDGRPVLVNRKMDLLSKEILNCGILNTEELWARLQALKMKEDQLPDSLQKSPEILFLKTSDKSVWQFERKKLPGDLVKFVQYTATDISQLYELQQQLSEKIRELKGQQSRQQQLLQEIVSNNRNSELLEAKMRIHDDFGQCLIASRQLLEKEPDSDQISHLMKRWKYCIDSMLVTDHQPDNMDSAEAELLKAAEMIGCRINFEGNRPEESETRLLLYAAVREALTNAVRHSRATEVKVRTEFVNNSYQVTITDDGSASSKIIREGNGLSNLRRRLEGAGALMEITCENGVQLQLSLPKGENP